MGQGKQILKKPDLWSGFFFLLFGVVVCIFSCGIGLGNVSKPGPGFFPFLGGLILLFLSAVMLVQLYRSIEWESWRINVNWSVIAAVFISMLAYGFLLERIGFVFIAFLFVASFLRAFEFKSWREVILGGVLSAIGSYLLFDTLLKVPLPKSFLRIF